MTKQTVRIIEVIDKSKYSSGQTFKNSMHVISDKECVAFKAKFQDYCAKEDTVSKDKRIVIIEAPKYLTEIQPEKNREYNSYFEISAC